jgi:hypothetical protein
VVGDGEALLRQADDVRPDVIDLFADNRFDSD